MPSQIIPALPYEASPTTATALPAATAKSHTRLTYVVWKGAHWREGTSTDDGQYFGYLLHSVTYHHINQQSGANRWSLEFWRL